MYHLHYNQHALLHTSILLSGVVLHVEKKSLIVRTMDQEGEKCDCNFCLRGKFALSVEVWNLNSPKKILS